MAGRQRVAFRITLLTTGSTFLLLIVGGVVHATDSGLACPDWPQCFGSFFPPMVGQVFYEHGHRIFATLVGNLAILQLVLHWRAWGPGHPARSLAAAALGLVIFQGVLGGMTVRMKLPDAVSTAHLATSMIFLSLQLWLAFRARPATGDAPLAFRLRAAIGLTAVLVYMQIVLGAVVRHTDSGLACTTVPLCRGALWVFGADWQMHVHVAHRLAAVVVSIAVIAVSLAAIRAAHSNRLVRTLALAAPAMVVVQVFLGLMSVLTALEVVVVTAHLAGGALLLATLVAMWFAGQPMTSTSATGGSRAASIGERASDRGLPEEAVA